MPRSGEEKQKRLTEGLKLIKKFGSKPNSIFTDLIQNDRFYEWSGFLKKILNWNDFKHLSSVATDFDWRDKNDLIVENWCRLHHWKFDDLDQIADKFDRAVAIAEKVISKISHGPFSEFKWILEAYNELNGLCHQDIYRLFEQLFSIHTTPRMVFEAFRSIYLVDLALIYVNSAQSKPNSVLVNMAELLSNHIWQGRYETTKLCFKIRLGRNSSYEDCVSLPEKQMRPSSPLNLYRNFDCRLWNGNPILFSTRNKSDSDFVIKMLRRLLSSMPDNKGKVKLTAKNDLLFDKAAQGFVPELMTDNYGMMMVFEAEEKKTIFDQTFQQALQDLGFFYKITNREKKTDRAFVCDKYSLEITGRIDKTSGRKETFAIPWSCEVQLFPTWSSFFKSEYGVDSHKNYERRRLTVSSLMDYLFPQEIYKVKWQS